MPRIKKRHPEPIARFIERLEAQCNFDPEKYNSGGAFDFSSQASLLNLSLSAAVPLWHFQLADLKKSMTPEQFGAELGSRSSRCAHILAEHGDALMFKIKDKSAQAFNALAEGIACMSFCPGGVEAFGTRWEYKRVREELVK